MKKYLSIFFIFLILQGCAATLIKVSPNNMKTIKKIAVVPMEPLPLDMSPLIPIDEVLRSSLQTSSSSATIQAYSPPPPGTGKAGYMISGILMLANLPEARKGSANTAKCLGEMLSSKDAWIPTKILAQHIENTINLSGLYDAAVINKTYKYPEWTNKENWFWFKPLMSWYKKDVSPFIYKDLNSQGIEGVIEVGLGLFLDHGPLSGDYLAIFTCLKLIDTGTGRVTGKAMHDGFKHNEVKTGDINSLFANNGERFKKLFAEASSEIITKELKRIGILPE